MNEQGRRTRGRPERSWLDRVRDSIKEKGLSGRKCTAVLHGERRPTYYVDPT